MTGRHLLIVGLLAVGCHQPTFPTVPGQTDVVVTKVSIEPRTGEHLEVEYKELLENLGLRAKDPIRPQRTWNPYRMAEDRRRVEAYLHGHGHFDAAVAEPDLAWSADKKSVAVTWRVHEGEGYKIGSVAVIGAPAEYENEIRAMVPFKAGDEIELEAYRPVRRAMAERLQELGYGHARGYSRTFVDKDKKSVAWFYYLDPGPKTHVAAIKVEGNHQVPADNILARAGLSVDGNYSLAEKRRAELALLDTGAFASAVVMTDADIQTGPPEHPDTGGVLAPEQIDGDGNLVPRKLSDGVAVRLVVVEAPRRQLRLELGVEADPTRVDSFAGARVLLRNALGPQHHIVAEGNVGYGLMIGRADKAEPGKGVYGGALLQYLHPTARTLDLRLTGRWRDQLYPDSLLREIVAGPGVRSTLAPGVFIDVDAFYRFSTVRDQAAIDPMAIDGLALATDDSKGAELEASIIADRRNDRVEPTEGWLLGLRSSYSPGGSLGDHRWLSLVGDARAFRPLNKDWSIGVRGSYGVVLLPGDEGIPLGPRLFGGGSHGFRGFGRDRLSPAVTAMDGSEVLVGGRSLLESSAELRLLPFRKLYGAAVFVDAGATGAETNAFENGISIAGGVGVRIRSWYLPIAIDLSYRVVEENKVAGELGRLLVFFRIGEAF